MTENIFEATGSDIKDVVDIDGNEGWKAEVHKLLNEIHDLKNEVVGSQLMTGLILQKVGAVEVSKEDIAKGLQGYGIDLQENDDSFTFTLKESDDN